MEAASNAGLAATTSKYVAIHDDDDLWAPEFLERTVAALEESGALMCTTRIVERYERENADGEFEVYEERIFHDGLPGVGLQFLFRRNRADRYSLPPQPARAGRFLRRVPAGGRRLGVQHACRLCCRYSAGG